LRSIASASETYYRKLTYGKTLPERALLSVPLRFPYIASSIHRVMVLEKIAENEGITYTLMYNDLNEVAEDYDLPSISTAMLCLHARDLKRSEVKVKNSGYRLTDNGKTIANAIREVTGFIY
jgi:hypothetical protein